MGILTEEMRRVIRDQKLGFVATVCPDQTPNLSPKGAIVDFDDDHIAFAHIRSPATIRNLRQNPSIEINVVDPLERKGYRFKGTGLVLETGHDFEVALERLRGRGVKSPIKAVVLVRIERALPITSPAYDDGTPVEAIRNRWLDYWWTLWSARFTQGREDPRSRGENWRGSSHDVEDI